MAENKSTNRHPAFKDITGQVFGRLTVVEAVPAPEGKPKLAYWLCTCECGNDKITTRKSLRQGHTTRCKRCKSRKHGMYKSPEYGVWACMLYRCSNTTYTNWGGYGGRGIAVCDRWRFFEAFFEDMGPRPSSRHSVERKNNDLGYCKENCVWATPEEQSRNTRRNRWLTHNGKTMCLTDWAARIGISTTGLRRRLAKGWSVEKAITTPVSTRAPNQSHGSITHDGVTRSLREWSEHLDIKYHTLLFRIRAGWSIDRVLGEGVHGIRAGRRPG